MKIKINNYTYIFLFLCCICGYIKNILIIFFICFFHELGHVFFIKTFNYNIISIEILPFGGFTNIDKHLNSNINKDLIISFGGIISQILLFIIFFIFKKYFNIITYNLLIYYNFLIIIFNILPIIPLDGNNIIHLLLEKIFPYELAYKINAYISIILLLLFIIINYIFKFDNYFIISFLIYKLFLYIKNYKYLKNRFLLERLIYNIDYNKINNYTKDIHSLKKEVLHFFKKNNVYINEKEMIKKKYYDIIK